ncbi:hypothetical protein PM082_018485 [Marasmius tenuissimus]|nr:hypothetical protein PM082_018485 [Marasmius tenuissimus]
MISEPQQLVQKIMTLSNFTAQIKDLAQALIVASVGKKLPPVQGHTTTAVQRRREEFQGLPLANDLATAKIGLISRLSSPSYVVVLVGNDVLIGQVITIYEKEAGSSGKHGWVSESANIGAPLYVSVQLWKQVQDGSRQFRASYGPLANTGVPHFGHLPSTCILHLIPKDIIRQLKNSGTIELTPQSYSEVFLLIFSSKERIVQAAKEIQKHKKKANSTQVPVRDDVLEE